MRGLMTKDIRLLFQRKQSILILLFVVVMMFVSQDNSFSIGYMTFLSIIFATNTISYDDYDNGYLFLMSLPIDAKMYVLEKYLFCILSSGIAWVTGILLSFILAFIRQTPVDMEAELTGALLILAIAMIIISVMLFFYIKFGPTKGGTVMAMFSGAFFALIMVIGRSGLTVAKSVEKIGQQPIWLPVAAAFAVGILLTIVSIFSSIRIMEKREF